MDLYALGSRVISVFGSNGKRVLVEMSSEVAAEMFPEPLGASSRTGVIDAVDRDLEAIRSRDGALADSALAASARALAFEIEHPFNSATSKSMCAKELRDTLDRLRELAPAEETRDKVDDLSSRRVARLAGGAGA